MSNNPQAAAEMLLEGYNCAQSVLACCGQQFGLPKETAIKVAQAFGGGMGRTGNVCGAVTGALMVIGLKHAVKNGQDISTKQLAHRLAQEFLSRFKAHHGSLLCRELLGCDISTEEGFKLIHDKELNKTICTKLVKDASQIIEDLLSSKK